MNGRDMTSLGLAFVGGVGVGFGICGIWLKRKMELEIVEQLEIMENVYQIHYNNMVEQAEERLTPEVVSETPFSQAAAVVIEKRNAPGVAEDISIEATDEADDDPNTYQDALVQVTEDVEQSVIEFIDEETFNEDDGRYKGEIQIVLQQPPVFVLDGEEIEDWAHRIGASILIDFFKRVPPGTTPMLWVRNHSLDEDYEVVQVIP